MEWDSKRFIAGWWRRECVADWRALFWLAHIANAQLLCHRNSFFDFVDAWVTGSCASALRLVSKGFHNVNLLFLVKCIRHQYMYLWNATTAVQFQSSQQKCSLLQCIPKHAIIILQVHNMIRGIYWLCEWCGKKCLQLAVNIMLNVLQNIWNVYRNNLHAFVLLWGPVRFIFQFISVSCLPQNLILKYLHFSPTGNCLILIWRWVNDVIVWTFLKCFAPLSVDCVRTPSQL